MSKTVNCNCKSGCQTKHCVCLKNNEPCDENCGCINCKNPLNNMTNNYWKKIINWNEQNKTWFWGGVGGVIIMLIGTFAITIYTSTGKQNPYLNIAKEFGVTENAVKNFFKIIEEKEVLKEDWDAALRKIATKHKELLKSFKQYENFIDPDIQELRKKAEQAINDGVYYKADIYLDEAFEKDMKLLDQRKLSAAENRAIKGDSLFVRSNYKKSVELYKKAVELVPDGHELKKSEYLQKWGDAAYDAGLYPESQEALKQCLRIREKLLPKDDTIVATTLNNLAGLYRSQGKYKKAELLYKRSLGIRETKLGKDHPDVAATLNNLAALYRSQGKYKEAEPLYKRSLWIRETKLGKHHPDVATTLNNLALLYMSQGKYKEAETLYKRSLGIVEKALAKDHPSVATTLDNLAILYNEQGRYEEAEALYKRSIEIEKKYFGKDHPYVATTLNNLGGGVLLSRKIRRGRAFVSERFRNI